MGRISCVERGVCFTSDEVRFILLSFICCQKGKMSVIRFRVILLTPKNDLIFIKIHLIHLHFLFLLRQKPDRTLNPQSRPWQEKSFPKEGLFGSKRAPSKTCNRLALDRTLTERGGVCKLIEGLCCVYIPPNNFINGSVNRTLQGLNALSHERRKF